MTKNTFTYDTCSQQCSADSNCTNFIHSEGDYNLSSIGESTQGYCSLYNNTCFSGPLVVPGSDFTGMWNPVKIMTKTVTPFGQGIAA